MAFEDLFPEYRSRGKEEGLGAIAEVLEVAGTGFVLGALEQRFGEEKTTLFMEDATDASGAPLPKDADGKQPKKSGTGIPMSLAGGVLVTLAAVAVPRMTMGMRKHALNVGTGLLTAFSYRKGIEKGQAWLDSAQPAGTPKMAAPMPPFQRSDAAVAEIANVKGEDDFDSNVSDFNREADRIAARRAAR